MSRRAAESRSTSVRNRGIRSDSGQSRSRTVVIAFLLLAITLAVYWPAARFGFIQYDDPDYVSTNSRVTAGLSWSGIVWAFTTGHAYNWHPLTWLSHMLDCQIFGLRPGWHHFTNVLFHTANTLLLFAVLRQMTGALVRSALVAALFALHPLHVESVAWISERKDLLSAFFFLLMLGAYARYGAVLSGAKAHSGAGKWYALALLFFAFGLMSKPMLVTVPFVLLLLDFWPLNRFERRILARLLLEKVPFLALSVLSSAATILAQRGAIQSLGLYSLQTRICNALTSYTAYLSQTFWPANLATPYPHPEQCEPAPVTVSLLLLLGLSAVAFWSRRRLGALFTGWFWFLGTLVPVIGLVQVGGQSRADRYTYIPLIGAFISTVWLCAELARKTNALREAGQKKIAQAIASMLAVVVLAACIWRTTIQLNYWSDPEKLFRHTVRVTPENYLAWNYLGLQLAAKGKLDEAIEAYRKSLQIASDFPSAYDNLGVALVQKRSLAEAAKEFRASLQFSPENLQTRQNLAICLLELGRASEAAEQFQTILARKPDERLAQYGLACSYDALGRRDDAIAEFESLLKRHPESAEGHFQLGIVFAKLDNKGAAISHLRSATRLKPDWLLPLYTLARLLAAAKTDQLRNGPEAVQLAERARAAMDRAPAEVQRQKFKVLDTLAAAYAETGRFEEAISTARQALELARISAENSVTAEIQAHLEAYQAHQPLRE